MIYSKWAVNHIVESSFELEQLPCVADKSRTILITRNILYSVILIN